MKKNIGWFFFTGILALLPLLLKMLGYSFSSTSFDWNEFYKAGELFAISSVICASCLGDVVLNNQKNISNKNGQMASILFLIAILLTSSVCFAFEMFISKPIIIDKDHTYQFSINLSLIIPLQIGLYLGSVVTGTLSRKFAL